MKPVRNKRLVAAFLLLLPSAPLRGQATSTAFLPEATSYFRLSSHVRLVFEAKGYMEDGDLDHAQIGPSLQFNLRPFEKLKEITVFDLDDMKRMPVVFTIGYRYLPSSVQPTVNRLQSIIELHIPFPGRTVITDRNRFDVDWLRPGSRWTYRNRVTLERRLTVRSYHPDPYVAAEFGYQSQVSKWDTTRLFAGCLLPVTGSIQLDIYYEHVNNTEGRPNLQVNAAGLIVNFYFPRYKNWK